MNIQCPLCTGVNSAAELPSHDHERTYVCLNRVGTVRCEALFTVTLVGEHQLRPKTAAELTEIARMAHQRNEAGEPVIPSTLEEVAQVIDVVDDGQVPEEELEAARELQMLADGKITPSQLCGEHGTNWEPCALPAGHQPPHRWESAQDQVVAEWMDQASSAAALDDEIHPDADPMETLRRFLAGRTVGVWEPFEEGGRPRLHWRGPGYDDGWEALDLREQDMYGKLMVDALRVGR